MLMNRYLTFPSDEALGDTGMAKLVLRGRNFEEKLLLKEEATEKNNDDNNNKNNNH